MMLSVWIARKGGEVSYLVKCMALFIYNRVRRGDDRMAVGFTDTRATSAYHH
jgi:hypothetical protein